MGYLMQANLKNFIVARTVKSLFYWEKLWIT